MKIKKVIIYGVKKLCEPVTAFTKILFKQVKLVYKNPTLRIAGQISASGTKFGKYNYISDRSVIHNSVINDYSYAGSNCFIDNSNIGKFTCIGPGVNIGLATHPSKKFISIHPIFYSVRAQVGITFSDKNYFEEYQSTFIGHDVWIGANAMIAGGVTVGNGAIIASGSVVTKDVPPYAIVGGIPANLIRMRFTEKEIVQLEEIKWWDKDIGWLRSNFKKMHDINNLELLLQTK